MANNSNNRDSFRGAFSPYSEDINVLKLVETSFFTPMGRIFSAASEESWGIPLFFEGPPGASKTSQFYWLAKRMGLTNKFESLKPSTRGPEFFGCTPVPSEKVMPDGSKVAGFNFPLPMRFAEKFSSGAGLILLDELTNAPPAVRPALLGFLQERELGEQKFSGRVRIFGAGNAVNESPTGQEFSPPEANRFGHLFWADPTVESLTAYFTNGCASPGDATPIDVEAREAAVVREFYDEQFPISIGAVAGFLKARPDMLRRQPAPTDPQSSRAWASPRTWEYAMRALASARCPSNRLNDSETELFVGSLISEAVANEFFVWQREQDVPSPVELLDGKVEFTPKMARLDRTVAVLASCVSLLTGESAKRDMALRKARADRFWDLAIKVAKETPDLLVPSLAPIDRAGLVGGNKVAMEVLRLTTPVVARV
jgi:MoxR-like ATPase